MTWTNNILWRTWYQGCGGYSFKREELDKAEREGCFAAEPKFDGIWCAAFGGPDDVRFFSRTADEKEYPNLAITKELNGVALFGELAFGSQESRRRRKQLGHDFMDVYELAAVNYDFKNLKRNGQDRYDALLNWWSGQSEWVQRHFRLAARYRSNFVSLYDSQPEGLVLKNLSNDGRYVGGGERVLWWCKAKKEKDVDMVIMDWNPSTAELKCADGRPRVKNLVCGMYVDGVLKPLVKVGSMKDALSVSIAANFEAYRGRVIALKHSGQFKSGSLRHPKVDPTLDRPVRDDKQPEECVFVPEK